MSFKDDMVDDITGVFLNEEDFAGAAVLRREGYPPLTISVIFTAAAKLLNPESGMVETTAPEALAASADVAGSSHGDLLVLGEDLCESLGLDPVDEAWYEIIGIEPDGTGMTRLVLSRDEAQP